MQLIRKYIRSILMESLVKPKVIFMAGGPGSGKSTVIRNLGLSNQLDVINPDDLYEETLAAEGIPLDRNAILNEYKPIREQYLEAVDQGNDQLAQSLEPEYLRLKGILSRNMVLFNQARKDARERKQAAMESRQNYIVDGTGGNYKEIKKQFDALSDAGYDLAMLFVDVPLEVSIQRDQNRGRSGGRSLGASTVERSWQSVDNNKQAYQSLFGENFFYIDADENNFQDSINHNAPLVQNFLS